MKKHKNILTKILKILGITIGSLLLLIGVLLLSLRLPVMQNFLKDRLVIYLEKKIKTPVSLERAYVNFPNSLEMENLYMRGQKVDTLLYARKLKVDLDILQLLNSKADLTAIDARGLKAHVVRNADGSFNFDYIVDAFAGNKNEEKKPSKPFIFSLDKINLEDIRVKFTDLQARNDLAVYFKAFNTRVQDFELEKNSYAFGDIVLDGLRLKMQQDLLAEVAEKVDEKVDSLRQKEPLKIGLKGLDFTNFDIDFADDNTKTYAKVLFKELKANVNKIDVENKNYDLDQIRLAGANITANLFLKDADATPKKTAGPVTVRPATPRLALGNLTLDDVRVTYNNTATGIKRSGMDFNHMSFSKLNTQVEDFLMENGTFAGTVKMAEIQEQRGLYIQKLQTKFAYREKEAYLKDLLLQTPHTILRDQVLLTYNAMEQLAANPGAVQVFANLDHAKIGFADILLFAPQLRGTTPFNTYPNGVLNLNTRVRGTMNNLNISYLQASGLGDLRASLKGRILNASVPEKLFYDLEIQNLSTSAATLHRLLPKGSLPKNITLPERFAVSGRAKGNTKVVDANLKLKSTLGDAAILAKVNMLRKNAEQYDVKADLRNLQLGKILQNKDLGLVSGQISAKGQNFDFMKGNAVVAGNLAVFDYQGYRYHNVKVDAKLNRGAYAVHLVSHDANANLNLTASGLLNEKNPRIKMKGAIGRLDLQKLGFYNKPMVISGDIDGDFSNLNPDYLNGHLYLNNFSINDGTGPIRVDQMRVEATSNASGNSLTVSSPILDLQMQGKYKLTQIFASLQNTLNSYYHFGPVQKKRIDAGQSFTLDATVKDDNLVRKFVPELKSFEPIPIHATYNADTRKIELDAKIAKLNYNDNIINNAALTIANPADRLEYSLTVDELATEKIALHKVAATGSIANDVITYHVTTRDEKDVERFLLAGTAKSLNAVTEISLDPEGLMLNYEKWTVNPGNRLQFGKGGIWAENFVLSNRGSQLTINSEGKTLNSPLLVDISNFKIEDITDMLKKDQSIAKGTINGYVRLKDFKNLNFTSDLTVSSLNLYGNDVGDLTAKVNTKTANLLDVNVALTGFDNDVRITGDYDTKASALDLVADFNRLQMKSVQGFSMNAIEDAEGYLSGRLDISGTTKAPNVRGALQFNDVGLMITKTGSNFRHINDEIRFVNEGISFDHFRVKDADGNAMVFDGMIRTQTYQDFAFDMTLKADDFKVIDSEVDSEKMMYGVLAINADLKIGGDMDLPKVTGSLAVEDNTDFTFVVPQRSPTKQEREGIVEFIDQDKVALEGDLELDSLKRQTDIKGMDVNVNISLTNKAKLSLIIDKASGDFVKLQGEAELTGGVDPSGKTTLVGVYQVEQGAYEMSFSLIKRKFEIQKGSTITWTGEPTMARLDIKAIYKTNAAPIDLVQQQIASENLNYYKQRIPFNTELILTGQLLTPIIKFDITTADENNAISRNVLDDVKTKLEQLRRDENELNKQVFALLVLNRFIGENPFQSESGVSAGTMARQSVSQILSQQLNNIASDLIAGVDLTFDFDSYDEYSTGVKNERTDLNVNLSKRLLNDRLKITVGSNFGIEGAARQNEQMTNIAGNISADYQLSKDGRYTLRAYRKNEYQVALQGQIIETGVGFVITLDYNEFKDIFERAKENRKARREIKAAEKKLPSDK